MYRTVCVALLLTTVVSSSQSCPRSCNCYQANEVHCTFRSLVTVPPGLPLHTRRINLGFNSISRIHGSSLTGLKRVELLMLHSNDLHHLPDAAFKDMKSLQILKLSYNKLREISSSLTFSGLTSLLRLYLDHNLLQFLHPRALLQLPSLRLLRLQGNRLHQLHPHALCTLSLLNTYYFSTLRHIDLSNNSLTTLAKDTLVTAPLLETVVLQANPWSCDCRMNWLLTWSVAHPGLMKCPGDPQCPTCASPNSLQGQGLLDQIDLLCRSPVIPFPGRNTPLESELSEIQSSETFREPLGSAFLGLSDQQGNNVDLSCNITLSSDTQDIARFPDLSLSSSIPLALSLSLECPVDTESYEILWRILAYYSETAVHLEREIMLSKDPEFAYRYKQVAETNGYYHTGVEASVKMKLQWLLQSAVSIQLNRAQSNAHEVHLIYSTRVSAHPDPTSSPLKPYLASQPWVLISTNHTITAMAAVSSSKVELSCPFLTSGNPRVKWILPDGSKLISPSSSLDGRLRASSTGLLLQKLQLSDAGLYYCVAQAGRDVDVLPLRLAVEESSVPPSGEQLGPSVTGTVGEPVSLSCKALGSPAPYLSWVFPDGNIAQSELALSSRFTIQPNGSLSLPDPSLRDAGYYRCIAVNHYGSDSLSMKLEIKPKHPPPLRVSYPRGPQSAAGRSTKIRAPLLRQMLEGSGDEEEEEDRTVVDYRKHPRPQQRLPNRRYPMIKPRRRGPMREGPPRRGVAPISSTDNRRNRFDTRHRVAANKQRIDPKKWAELLAKIRLKTAHTVNSQSITAGEPTADPTGSVKDRDTAIDKAADNTERGTVEDAGADAEIEGSSVDDTVLQEEGLQPIHPVLTEIHTHSDTKTDTDTEGGRETSTEPQANIEITTHTPTQTSGPKTVTVTNPETHQELVSSQPISKSNDIVLKPVEGIDRKENPNPRLSRPQSPRQRLSPNMVPNARPQRPWNTRRRIGQQRRIINRPRVQPLTPSRPLPDSSHHRSQTATPDTTIDKSNMLLASTTTQSTRNDQIKTAPSGVNLLSPHISYSPVIATSVSGSDSLTSSVTPFTSLSPSHIKPHIDIMTHAADIQETAESTLVSPVTLAPTDSNVVISQTYVLDTHGIQTRRKPHTALEKHVLKASSKDNEEQERNSLGARFKSHFTTLSSSTYSIVATTASSPTTAKTSTQPSTLFTSSARSTTTITREDTVPTTAATLVTTNPIKLNTVTAFIPPSSTTSNTTPTPTSTPTTTPVVTSTTSTTMMTSSTRLSTTSTTTTAATKTESSIKAILTTPNHSTTTAISTTPTTTARITTSAKATPMAPTSISSTTVTMTSASTRASFRERLSAGRVNTQGRPISGAPNPNRSPDWKKPGANFIPDSHRSRPHWSPSLPAVPGVPVLRSRPRIADPHIRTVSFPAESTARLTCEAQGEPKPSITWTKVATGAVMSIHSKAQRFEVLPNGTLVIQNVQLQDRGTYICSAQSFLGRDRLLTTLEVWTRPPRMQLASYRESTTHQGVEVLLECQADGVPAPLLSWVLPDRSVLTSSDPSTGRIFMDTNGTLHILGTLPSDRGVYRCVASNSAGAASSSVRVHVSSLPPVIQQPREEHLLLSPGMPVYAHCSARGAPPPYLRWRIPDGTLVRPSQFLHGNLFVLPNGTLHIRGVGPKDLGTYECTASNAVGADKRTVSVKMEREAKGGGSEDTKPVATEKTSSYSLSKDRSLSNPSHPTNPLNSPKLAPPLLTDRSRTLPITPSFSRNSFYPHQPSFPNSPYKTNKTIANTDKTKLSPVNNSKISPNVVNNTRVLSSTPFDKSRTTAVLYPMPVSPFSKARIISTSPSITTVHHGGILQLHCSVTGNPPPIIIWRTPIRKLVDMNFSFDRRLKVHPNGTLSVQAVTEKDAGDYLCIARNKVADDYRLLRVTVASKPAKIEPKQPLNQMVSLGKPLKVDCEASGLPDPAVHWSLPDGTMVNSVLQGEDRGGRARRLTVFDNGTLLVPAVGMGEEGEYTCYAENQGGQDTMKVKVKVMMTSPPAYTDQKTTHHTIKVRQGATATIHCPVMGGFAPTVMWLSPSNRIIPQSLGSGFYSERVVVVSDGTLEVRQAQKIDTGNYTCRASNSAGERSMVVSLEVDPLNHVISGPVGGKNAISINNAGTSQYGLTNGASSKLGTTNTNSNGYSNNNGNRNTELNVGINMTTSGSNPSPTVDKQNGFYRPVSGITFDSTVSSAGVSGASNIGSKPNNIGISRNGHSIVSSISNSVGNSHSTVPRTNYNEVITGRLTNDENTNRDNGRVSGTSRNVGVSSSITNSGAGTGTLRRNWFSSSGHTSITEDDSKKSDIIAASNTGSKNAPSTVVGVVTTVKQQVVKGQTVLLPCPSQGSPPPRLAWLLPGNGVLPAPYYGSRLTVHRNGSLELRGVRATDAGTLVCVVRGEKGETRIQVELNVSVSQEETRSAHRASAVERPVQKTTGLSEARHSGVSLDSIHSLSSVLHEKPRPRYPVTQKPPQKSLSSPAAPRPLGPPPHSPGPVLKPAESTRTASLVSIINGETLRLACPAPQTPGYTQGSLSWITPSGNMLSRGNSGDSNRYVVQEDGTLTVQQATVFDRGTYTCTSTNHESSLVSVITFPVIVIAYPPRITTGPSPVTYTRPGVAVELPCLTIATPRATVTWETPDLTQLRVMGQARIYGNRYLSPQGSLVIQNPTNRDTGFYRCTAKNVIGVDTKATYLHVM